jgi:hypothetical protein
MLEWQFVKEAIHTKDYIYEIGQMYDISWTGFLLSACVDSDNAMAGFHDQDFIHNGKKLINPLDSPMRVLHLGADVCFL